MPKSQAKNAWRHYNKCYTHFKRALRYECWDVDDWPISPGSMLFGARARGAGGYPHWVLFAGSIWLVEPCVVLLYSDEEWITFIIWTV